jgi:aminodeoxyfutalosine deaminase
MPKAELHLHLEGSLEPRTVRDLAQGYGVDLTEREVRRRYASRNFAEFIEAFKWVTSFLREPHDYAVVASDLAERLLAHHVVYAEVTLSVGVMLIRKQQPAANFAAILRATEPFAKRGLQLRWIFDAVRQFGAASALQVVQAAASCQSKSIVAFGIGGDELSVPTRDFRSVYDRAAQLGLHRLIHAGEIGGPENIREAIELLGIERVGHGIAAINDASLMDLLAERQIPLEICPASNLCTGALARQLNEPHATLQMHPLPKLFRHGIPVVLSTDDPAMFRVTLQDEYQNASHMGLTEAELAQLAAASFTHSFKT